MKQELNFNYSECVKSWDDFGTTYYKNICTNEEHSIPWGFGEYTIIGGFGVLFIFIILLLIYIIKEMVEWW